MRIITTSMFNTKDLHVYSVCNNGSMLQKYFDYLYIDDNKIESFIFNKIPNRMIIYRPTDWMLQSINSYILDLKDFSLCKKHFHIFVDFDEIKSTTNLLKLYNIVYKLNRIKRDYSLKYPKLSSPNINIYVVKEQWHTKQNHPYWKNSSIKKIDKYFSKNGYISKHDYHIESCRMFDLYSDVFNIKIFKLDNNMSFCLEKEDSNEK